ncbi:MAG: hypothetical protein IJE90_09135 [Clostridia bacterium]|nr:hypothetical protein [Clostridia bacterium]
MDKGFKTSVFGFRKKQVIAYLEAQKNEHNDRLMDAENDAKKLEQNKTELECRIKELKAQNEELALQRAALISQKEEMADSLDRCGAENLRLASQLDEQKAAVESLRTALASQLEELTEVKAEYDKCAAAASDDLITFENEKTQLSAELDIARRRIAELETENARMKRQAAREQVIKRIKTDPVRAILSYVKKK